MARHSIGRYELYKRATDRFTDWLTRTARQCRDLPGDNSLQYSNLQPKTTASEQVSTRELISYAVTIRDAQQRTEAVKAEVPDTILALLEAVIDGRQAVARSHATRPSSDIESNESHQFFIQALRQIRAILKPLVATSSSSRKQGASDTATSGLANIFSQLEIEEPISEPLGQEPRINTIANDDTFAFWCHIEDLSEFLWELSPPSLGAIARGSFTQAHFTEVH